MSKQDKEVPIRLPLIIIAILLIVTPLVVKAIDTGAEIEETKHTVVLKSISLEDVIIDYIKKTFPESPEIAVAVAKAESGLDPHAHGDKGNKLAILGSHGIFQINVAVHQELIGDRNVNDWRDNVDIAKEIYDNAGQEWDDWGAFNNKSYLLHL